MKKQLIIALLTLGLILWSLASSAKAEEPLESAPSLSSEISVGAARACPDCSGTAYTIKDAVFLEGSVCECTGTKSLTVGPNVTVQSGATVTFKAPTVNIKSGVKFESGAVIDIIREVSSPATLTLTATPDAIVADGVEKSTLLAVVKDAGGNNVADGTTVYFSTTRGLLSARSATTQSGNAQVTLTSSASRSIGTATVTASTGTAADTTKVDFTSDVTKIVLTADPTQIPSDGATYATLMATLTNSSGAPVLTGTSLTFATTLGTLSNGLQTSTFVLSDDTGIMVDFLKGKTTGTATITVSSGTAVPSTKQVVIYSDDPSTVTVSAAPSTLTADGTSTSTITVIVTNSVGDLVADGTSITLSAVSGALSATSVTTVNGKATVTYTAPNAIPGGGTDTVTATSNGKIGTANIAITAVSVGSVTIAAAPDTIVADGDTTSTISATVKSPSGGPVEDGKTVNFTATSGTLSAPSAVTSNGVATVTLTSTTNRGTSTVRAICEGAFDNTTVTFIAGAPATVTVSANPNGIQFTGATKSKITVSVVDANGNPVEDGTTVNFSVTAGGGTTPATLTGTFSSLTATTENGLATVEFTSPGPVGVDNGLSTNTVTATATNGVSGFVVITDLP